MNTAKVIRKVHRFAGLVIGIQILLWTISGFYFSLIPIGEIRGDHLATPAPAFEMSNLEDFREPGIAINSFRNRYPAAEIQGVSLKYLRGRDVYFLNAVIDGKMANRLVDARTGEMVPMMTEQEAELAASQLIEFDAPLKSIELLETAGPDDEFRDRPLPLYKLSYDHDSGINLYLDAWTSELTARRTTFWRVFDFLWMLHIMDYDERSDFNNNLLRVFAFFSLLFVISGFMLWFISSRYMQRRRARKLMDSS